MNGYTYICNLFDSSVWPVNTPDDAKRLIISFRLLVSKCSLVATANQEAMFAYEMAQLMRKYCPKEHLPYVRVTTHSSRLAVVVGSISTVLVVVKYGRSIPVYDVTTVEFTVPLKDTDPESRFNFDSLLEDHVDLVWCTYAERGAPHRRRTRRKRTWLLLKLPPCRKHTLSIVSKNQIVHTQRMCVFNTLDEPPSYEKCRAR